MTLLTHNTKGEVVNILFSNHQHKGRRAVTVFLLYWLHLVVISGHCLLKSVPVFEQNDQQSSEEVLMAMGDHCGAVSVGGDHPHLPAHQQVHLQKRYVCVRSTTLEVFRGQTVYFFQQKTAQNHLWSY